MTTAAVTARCLDRYERDDAETLRIEAQHGGVSEADIEEAMAEAHREQARRLTARAWARRPKVVCEEGDW